MGLPVQPLSQALQGYLSQPTTGACGVRDGAPRVTHGVAFYAQLAEFLRGLGSGKTEQARPALDRGLLRRASAAAYPLLAEALREGLCELASECS